MKTIKFAQIKLFNFDDREVVQEYWKKGDCIEFAGNNNGNRHCENMQELIFTGITTDSRIESSGELFVALCGWRF